jgi:hypothetical protein
MVFIFERTEVDTIYFNTMNSAFCPHSVFVCSYHSDNKQRLFSYIYSKIKYFRCIRTYVLFNDGLNNLNCISWNGKVISEKLIGGIWKEGIARN